MQKRMTAAGCMLLLWLGITVAIAAFLPKWADFSTAIACASPMLLFSGKLRGATFGARDTNTVKYRRKDYAAWFCFTVSGSAVLSAATYFAFGSSAAQGRNDFFYLLVFACMLPAFFEEYLVRGGVFGALAEAKGSGVLMTAILFALMHMRPARMLYALFAGICITTVVYLSENIYLGMLLHFINNLASLLLSYLPRGTAEYVALGILVLLCLFSLLAVLRGRLFADAKVLWRAQDGKAWRAFLNPAILLFVLWAILLGIR